MSSKAHKHLVTGAEQRKKNTSYCADSDDDDKKGYKT